MTVYLVYITEWCAGETKVWKVFSNLESATKYAHEQVANEMQDVSYNIVTEKVWE